MEHLPAFSSTSLLKQQNCIILKFNGRTFSDEEQKEMVFFFAIDFHALMTLGRECFHGSCQQQITRAHFITLIKVKKIVNIDDMNNYRHEY